MYRMFAVKFLKGCETFTRMTPVVVDVWSLHHNIIHLVMQYSKIWKKKKIPVLPHPSYSSDFSDCDFFIFMSLGKYFKEHYFATTENTEKYNRSIEGESSI